MPEGSVEHAAYSNKRPVLLLNKVVFGNPYGTPQLLQRLIILTNQVLGPWILVEVVPPHGLEPRTY
ncbi:MAG: hypothetical protein ACPGKG_03070 [Paracoccaceae bacterium]